MKKNEQQNRRLEKMSNFFGRNNFLRLNICKSLIVLTLLSVLCQFELLAVAGVLKTDIPSETGQNKLIRLPESIRASLLPVHTDKALPPEIKKRYLQEMPGELAVLKNKISSQQEYFRNNSSRIPPEILERTDKRFKLAFRLEHFIEHNLAGSDNDSILFAKRGLRDLALFYRYFDEEAAYAEKINHLPEPVIVSVRDFGAKGDGKTDDTLAIRLALEKIAASNNTPHKLFFPQGIYRIATPSPLNEYIQNVYSDIPEDKIRLWFSREGGINMVLQNLKNVTICGETSDTQLVFDNERPGIIIVGCENVKIQRLAFRYSSEIAMTGTIVAFDMEKKYLIMDIESGPAPDEKEWAAIQTSTGQACDLAGNLTKFGSDIKWAKKFEKLGPQRYKLHFESSRFDAKPGSRIAFPLRKNSVVACRIMFSKFCSLEDVTFYNSFGPGINVGHSYGISLLRTRIIPLPGRIISSAADAIICQQNYFGVYLQDCLFQNMGDDGFNNFGRGTPIYEFNGKSFSVNLSGSGKLINSREVVPTDEPIKLTPEHYIYIVDAQNGQIKGEGMLTAIRHAKNISGHLLVEFELDREINQDTVSVRQLEPDLPYAELFRRRNISNDPDDIFFFHESGVGAVISGCRIGNNRHNGLTIQSTCCLVEKNTIGNCSTFGIRIGAYSGGWKKWAEAPVPYNIMLSDNKIYNAVSGIRLDYFIRRSTYPRILPLRDIIISGNHISDCDNAIWIRNALNVIFSNNTFDRNLNFNILLSDNIIWENNIVNGVLLPLPPTPVSSRESIKELQPAWLFGKTDKPPFYRCGEPMNFEIELKGIDPKTLKHKYFIQWKRTGDDGKINEGKIPISQQPLKIATSLDRPGFVRIEAWIVDEKDKPILKDYIFRGKPASQRIFFDGGAAADWEKIRQCQPEPEDFDRFWSAQKAKLAAIPVRSTLKQIDGPKGIDLYEVSVSCAGSRPVTGYLSIPSGAKTDSLPVNVQFHGYGTTIPVPPKSAPTKKIRFSVNAHGYDLGKDKEYYNEFFASIKSNSHRYAFDPEQNKNPETSYFYGMALRVMRALQFVQTLPQWDHKHLHVSGGSQGGLQTIWAAALDPVVTSSSVGFPWNCDIAQTKPQTLRNVGGWMVQWIPGLDYYDACNHAKRIKSPITITRAGLGDYTCPPSGITAMYHNITAPKTIIYYQGAQHTYIQPDAQQYEFNHR